MSVNSIIGCTYRAAVFFYYGCGGQTQGNADWEQEIRKWEKGSRCGIAEVIRFGEVFCYLVFR